MALTHLPADTDAEKIADVVRAQGAVIVDDLAPAATLDRFAAELGPWMERTPLGTDDFSGHNTRRTGALIQRSPTARDLVMHPLVLGAANGLLDDATSIQLHLTQVIAIGPDSPAQGLHRDQWAFDFFPFPLGYDVQLNTLWAMSDFTEANGATRVVPGSNTAADGTQYTHDDSEPAEMSRGSVLIYSGSVYHGGGANTTDEVRSAINITYCRSWLRQEENQYLSVERDVAATLDDDLLRLMGYQRGAYALGYIDDLRDPIEALPGKAGRGTSFG